jgi:hypothetical protein
LFGGFAFRLSSRDRYIHDSEFHRRPAPGKSGNTGGKMTGNMDAAKRKGCAYRRKLQKGLLCLK